MGEASSEVIEGGEQGHYATKREELADSSVSAHWWIPIALWGGFLPLALIAGLVGGLFSIVVGDIGMTLIYPVLILSALSWPLSIVGVYKDRRYVAAHSEWVPTKFYYLSILSVLGMLIAAHYTWTRHKHLGVP